MQSGTQGVRPRRRHAAWLWLALAAACGGAMERPITATVRDSAGVEVVENTAALWRPGEEWQLTGEPILDIGSELGNPNYEFGYAHGPVRLRDGRIVVADMQTNVMRFYDATGRYLSESGGSGEGPGEFEQLYRLRKISDDTLMALNPSSLTSLFSADGRYVRRFQLSPVRGRGNLWWLGYLSDHTLLAVSLQRRGTRELAAPAEEEEGVEHARFDVPERPDEYRDSLLHFLFTMEGELIDSLGEWPGQWIGRERPFAPNAAYAFHGDAFYHSPGDHLEIRQYRSLAGRNRGVQPISESPPSLVRLERVIRRGAFGDPTVTESVKEKYRDERRAMYRQVASRNPGMDMSWVERQLAETKFPLTLPAHANRMYADALGHLWLQEYRVGTVDPFRWSVFDPNGFWLGVVETPAAFTVNEIGEDYVLGIWQDSLDVQHVRMYGLSKNRR